MKKDNLSVIAAKANSLTTTQSSTIKGGADIIATVEVVMGLIIINDVNAV